MPAVPRIAAMTPPMIMPLEVPFEVEELVGLGNTEEDSPTLDGLPTVWMNVVVVGVDDVRCCKKEEKKIQCLEHSIHC